MSRLQMCAIVKLYLPEMSQLYARSYHEGWVEERSELGLFHIDVLCFYTLFCFSMAIDHNSSVVYSMVESVFDVIQLMSAFR